MGERRNTYHDKVSLDSKEKACAVPGVTAETGVCSAELPILAEDSPGTPLPSGDASGATSPSSPSFLTDWFKLRVHLGAEPPSYTQSSFLAAHLEHRGRSPLHLVLERRQLVQER